MNPAIALYLLQALQLLPLLISTGQNVMTFFNKTQTNVNNMIAENRAPSDAEWADLNASTASLRVQLHSPRGTMPTTPVPGAQVDPVTAAMSLPDQPA
jgi:hypothetical protein